MYSTGFGQLSTLHFTEVGYRVVAGCLTAQGCEELQSVRPPLLSSCARPNVNLLSQRTKRKDLLSTVVCNVTKETDVIDAVRAVEAASTRGARLWAIVNNAGIVDGSLLDLTQVSQYRNTMEVNFLGLVSVCKHFLRTYMQTFIY